MRLYRNRQGLTKGKKSGGGKAGQARSKSSHTARIGSRTDPFGGQVVSRRRDHRHRRQRLRRQEHSLVICRPTFTSSAMSIPREHSTNRPTRRKEPKDRPQERKPPARHEAVGRGSEPTWTELKFNQFGLHATLAVKTIQALYYKAGGDRLLTIVLVRDLEGKRPDQMFYCTKLDWTARQILYGILLPLGDRMHLRKLQTALGSGGPGQSSAQGRGADRALGVDDLQPGRGVVPQDGTSIRPISVPPLVFAEGRTVVCRSADHPAPGQLGGENPHSAFGSQ